MNCTQILYLAMLIPLGNIACVAQEQGHMQSNTVAYGLGLIRDHSSAAFAVADDEKVPAHVRSNSEYYLSQFLRPEALPWANKFVLRSHVAENAGDNDLIEYRWDFRGRPFRIVESINVAKLIIPIDLTQSVEAAKELVSAIVNVKGTDAFGREYKVALRWPALLATGTQFSSDPNTDIRRISSWHERLDAIVQNDGLELLFYKKVPQLMGYQPGAGWFKRSPAQR